MKKHFKFHLVLLMIPIVVFSLLSLSGGRTGQYSGSPGDNFNTCSNCHSGGNFNAVAEITTNIPPEGFSLGSTYEITVSVNSSSSKQGFQLTVEDANNTKIGNYMAGVGNQIVNSGTHVTHTAPGNSQHSWTFDWTAPASIEGNQITFYAAINATNSNGSTSGDQVVTTSLSYSLNTVAIKDNQIITFNTYPNPTKDFISLDYDNNSFGDVKISIINDIGQIVAKFDTYSDKIDIKNLPVGVYFIKVLSGNRIAQSKFIKE